MNTLSRLYYPRHHLLWAKITHDEQDLAHDAEHILRVYRWAVQIAADEEVDPDLAGAAALVHDLINTPKESEERSQCRRTARASKRRQGLGRSDQT